MGLRRRKRLLWGCFTHLDKAQSKQFYRSSMRKLIAILAFVCVSYPMPCTPWNGTGIDDVDDYHFREDDIGGDTLEFMLPHFGTLWTSTSLDGPWERARIHYRNSRHNCGGAPSHHTTHTKVGVIIDKTEPQRFFYIGGHFK